MNARFDLAEQQDFYKGMLHGRLFMSTDRLFVDRKTRKILLQDTATTLICCIDTSLLISSFQS